VNSGAEKVYQILGLCQRAGKLVSGEMMCEKAINEERARLVIISSDASENTIKKFKDMCDRKQIDFLVFGSKDRLGQAIGREMRTSIAILDHAFKSMIVKSINDHVCQNGGEQ